MSVCCCYCYYYITNCQGHEPYGQSKMSQANTYYSPLHILYTNCYFALNQRLVAIQNLSRHKLTSLHERRSIIYHTLNISRGKNSINCVGQLVQPH